MNALPPQTTPLSGIADEAQAALQRLTSLGFKTTNSRLVGYARTLRRFANLDSADIANQGGTRLVGKTLFEAADFIEIVTLPDEYLRHRAIEPRVQKAIHGRLFRDDHVLVNDPDANRDAAFELCAAAYLYKHGALGAAPENDADLIFRDGDCLRPVECKRLSSAAGLKDNLRTARKQIEKRVKNGPSAGLAAIDVSRVLNPACTLFHYESAEAMVAGASQKLRSFVDANLEQLQHQDVFSPALLGVAVRLLIPGYAGGAANVRRFIEWQFVPIQRDEVGSALFDLCIEQFGIGEINPMAGPPAPKLARLIEHALSSARRARCLDASCACEKTR